MIKSKIGSLLTSASNGDFEEITDDSFSYIKDKLIDGGELLEGYEFNIHVYKITPKVFLILSEDKEYLGIWYSFCKDNDKDFTCLCSKGDLEHVAWEAVIALRSEVWDEFRDKPYQVNKYHPVFDSTEIDVYE